MITRNEKLWLLFIYSLLSLIILGSTYLHHFQPHILRVPDNTDLASWTRPAFENTEIYRHATEEERTKLLSEGIPDGDRILFQFLTIDLIMILAGWFWFRHAKKHYGYWMASAFLVGSFIFTGLEESMWILLGRFIPQTITTPLGDVVYGTYWFTKGALWFIGTPVFNCLGWFIIAYPCVHFTGKLFPKLKLGSRAALGGLVAVIGIDSWMDPLYTSSEFMFWVWAQYDIITIFGIVILLSEADNIFRTFLPMPEKLAEFFRDYLAGEKSFLGSFFLLVIVAPVTEEALFRGLVLRGFLIRYSVRKAILVSALLFGMFHLLPWQIFSGSIAGILFAWLFIKTGSLLPCIIAHAVSNSVPSILTLTKFRIPGFTGDMTTVEHQPLWFDFIGLVLAAAGLYWLVQIFKKNDSKEPAPESINP